jgi:hypothetical protein
VSSEIALFLGLLALLLTIAVILVLAPLFE